VGRSFVAAERREILSATTTSITREQKICSAKSGFVSTYKIMHSFVAMAKLCQKLEIAQSPQPRFVSPAHFSASLPYILGDAIDAIGLSNPIK
jgi:hypothetical protein